MSVPPDTQEISATTQTAVPGFLDIHIHGAGGHDVMEGSDEALGAVTRTVASHGTTSILATTVTASLDDTYRSVEAISRYIAQQHTSDEPRAEVLGLHFEGPFLSPERRGVHPKEFLLLPSAEVLEKLLQASAGTARILTLAPELLGAAPCIDAARSAGVVVAMGHTDATYE